MEFQKKRRQQFLGEQNCAALELELTESIAHFASNPYGSGRNMQERMMLARMSSARDHLRRLTLQYTAGALIEPLRQAFEQVIAAYEGYGELLREFRRNRDEAIFDFTGLDDYCELMRLVGLCFLLHRRDLLPRLAAMQDGPDGASGGVDTLYEEFMAYGLGADTRYDSEWLCHKKPYEPLFHALTETTQDAALTELDRFLKHWYKDLAGTGWHDSHKPDENGNQGGYYGYWSFEAGAAVLLLGIDDDSSLHKYLYYPKDLVAWARSHSQLSDTRTHEDALRLRCEAGHHCPRTGWWVTPAQADSRRHFQQGEVMIEYRGDYGSTIWQWDDKQT